MYRSRKPTLQQNLLLRKIVRKWTKRTNNWYQQNITNIWTFSAKKRHTVSPNRDLGITRSKRRKDLSQNHLKTITLHQQNNSNWTNSWRKISKNPAISIANGLPIFLCFQKRWQTLTLSGLLVFKQLDGQKLLSFTTNLGDNGQT
jgi:hypothetical protein